jgi:hypothetical protein
VGEFGRQIGIPDAQLDDYGSWSFVADDILVNIQTREDGSFLDCYSFLGKIEHPGEELYETLLEANFFSRGIYGATIGVSGAAHLVTLAYRISANGLDGSRFFKIMENFINLSAHWRDRITQMQETSPRSDPSMGVNV